ncbi:hypothetical protein D3C81_10370 [compost metagenome]
MSAKVKVICGIIIVFLLGVIGYILYNNEKVEKEQKLVEVSKVIATHYAGLYQGLNATSKLDIYSKDITSSLIDAIVNKEKELKAKDNEKFDIDAFFYAFSEQDDTEVIKEANSDVVLKPENFPDDKRIFVENGKHYIYLKDLGKNGTQFDTVNYRGITLEILLKDNQVAYKNMIKDPKYIYMVSDAQFFTKNKEKYIDVLLTATVDNTSKILRVKVEKNKLTDITER